MMKRGVAVLCAALVLMAGCKVVPHGAMVADVDPHGWEPEEVVTMTYQNTDTTSLRAIRVVARVESSHSSEPMELSVAVVSPDTLRATGVVTLPVTEESISGGSFEEREAMWVEEAVLMHEGCYRFELAPLTTLEDVWSVGVEIVEWPQE